MKYETQTPVKGGRKRLSACVIKEIKTEVDHCARRYGVSKSFVQNTALAAMFGIKIETYYERTRPRLRRVK